jgi:hypothetical protein
VEWHETRQSKGTTSGSDAKGSDDPKSCDVMSVFEEANVGFEIFVTRFVPTPEAISSNGLNARYV